MDHSIREMVYGKAQMRSPWFSNRWRFMVDGVEICRVHRLGTAYTSIVSFDSGAKWVLDPHGNGVVRALDNDGNEFGRVVRRSWIGRRWDLLSKSWNYELISHPRPRAWAIGVGGAPLAEIRGSLVSYNRVDVNAMIGVPLGAVLLSWHVIARPWEAVSEPSGLVPVPQPVDRERSAAPSLDTGDIDFFRDR
jgi:hypothetical protein